MQQEIYVVYSYTDSHKNNSIRLLKAFSRREDAVAYLQELKDDDMHLEAEYVDAMDTVEDVSGKGAYERIAIQVLPLSI